MVYSLPYSFGPGEVARPQEVNANFNAIINQLEEINTAKADIDLTNITSDGIDNIKNTSISKNIGEFVFSLVPLNDSSLHLLDGSLITPEGIYSDFCKHIRKMYYEYEYPNCFTTESDWQQTVNEHGSCGKFVYSEEENTVRLPKISSILEFTTDLNAIGDIVEAGLPNITGVMTFGEGFPRCTELNYEGALSGEAPVENYATFGGGNSTGKLKRIELDASRSSSIYGNSSTVQPQTIKTLIYIVVATSAKTDIQIDIDEIATDLNAKADKDGSNMNASVKNFDGQWVSLNNKIANSVTWDNTTPAATYDISSYLPNDNYNYEVLISGEVIANATDKKFCTVSLSSDIQTSTVYLAAVRATSSSSTNPTTNGNLIIPVGTGRTITQYSSTSTNAGGVYSLWIKGYRRIGTNA
ncbi:hypothetical protein IJ596_02725 [bacterium]|nr:hypothetical protein [bacterium]